VRAVDTNILARFILADDETQSAIAQDVIRSGVYVSLSVWMELVWLLEARYRLSRSNVADALDAVMRMVVVSTPDDALWALDRYRFGADFADMVHLAEVRTHEAFLTFDRALEKDAGPASLVPVELLH
jgi:predicted nucleic-acid-binding protein